ncbi:MAG: GTP-binding protein [Oscillospiraceae bacterium]|nr:GTP-binding protein [Oscillospiraceae bacterium]
MDIQIVSGFLGAGKTTFINKYLPLLDGLTVVIENEFGQIGLDGQLIEGDTPVRELRAGCICCTLATSFQNSINELWDKFHPDHILIEPSGIAMLHDVVSACEGAREEGGLDFDISKRITIVSGDVFEDFIEDYPFYLEQVENAGLILLSHIAARPNGTDEVVERLRGYNSDAVIYSGDWRELDGDVLMSLVQASPQRPAEPSDEQHSVDAGQVFSNFAILKPPALKEETPEYILRALQSGDYGEVLRAKGFLSGSGGQRYYIDLTISGAQWRSVEDDGSHGLVVIGRDLQKPALKKLFTGK